MEKFKDSQGEWLGFGRRGGKLEWRKILARSTDHDIACVRAARLQRIHKARMTVTEVDGIWVVFRSRNRA